MALPGSGTIKLSDIKTEFSGGNNLTDYYRNGSYVPDYAQNSGVPTSGSISLTDFYGASDVAPAQNYYPTGNNLNITSSVLSAQGFNSSLPVNVYINSQAYGTTTSNNALYINNLSGWADVTFHINALLRGDGGNGGNSSNGSGGAGGPALLIHASNTSSKLTIYNNSTIYAGGGGGGGGARYSVSDYRTSGTSKDGYTCNFTATRYRGGGGGGGGRGYSAAGGARTTSTDGCSAYAHGVAGGTGTASVNGAGGSRGYTYNQPGSTNQCGSCRIAYGGSGGAGGGIGATGSNGTSGAGGAKGYAIRNYNHASWPSGLGSYVGSLTS